MSTEAVLSAIERARMVAAKLSSQIPNGGGGGDYMNSMKRSADDDGSNPKKFANISDAVGAQLAALKAQQLGGGSYSEDYKVPDKLVGLVIGRGGEQIIRLQAESGCKVQIAPDSMGQPDRVITLSGSRESVEKTKRMIEDIIKRGASSGTITDASLLPRGQEVFEMRIPGNKCGLVIGKNGETIKKLSEQYGVKLVVIQETSSTNVPEKPLRITGDADKVQRAKEAVMALIKDQPQGGRGGGGGGGGYSTNDYGSSVGGGRGGGGGNSNGSGQSDSYIKVPGDKAGIVIGKGGETIKDIKNKSGAHVEIDKNFRSDDTGEKMFIVKGTYDQIQYAQQLIYEKITGIQGSQPPSGFFGPDAVSPSPQYGSNSYGGGGGGGRGSSSQSSSASQQQSWGASANPYAAQQGWQQQADPSGKGGDAASQDQIAQAWAAYYQYYQSPTATTGTTAGGATAATASASTASGAAGTTPSVNPQTGQQDYSQAWVEYYRSMGMYAEADAILRQTQGQTPGSATSNPAGSPTSTSQSASTQNATQQQQGNWQNYAAYGGGYPYPTQ